MAANRVRSVMSESSSSRSTSYVVRSNGRVLTTMPRSAAMVRHGVLLPSCSMCVVISSSPGWNLGPSTRVIMKVRLVMLGPNTTSRSEAAL